MASLIKGITVKLHEAVQTGTDRFNRPIYSENLVDVSNVLVCPATSDDLVNDLQLNGKQAQYVLCIPKSDAHVWEDCKVDFFGHTWKTFGFAQELIAENVPLDWNKKIKVERYA